jgi:23S rRNA pseudouridine2605 synthase
MQGIPSSHPKRRRVKLRLAHRATWGYFAAGMRLNRFLASAGLGSRRGVEELVKAGRVRINGRVVTDLATQVGSEDSVKVGTRMVRPQRPIHAVLNKPRGYLCTAADERERRTIFELLPKDWPRFSYVGRLDKESEGLLIVTNDGELSLALTHPRYHVEKEYEVALDKTFDILDREKLLRGFRIEGGWAKAERVVLAGPQKLKLVLRQGIKRQIRLMFFNLGYEVAYLRRVRIGPLKLGGMQPGEWRLLSTKEVQALRNAVSSRG